MIEIKFENGTKGNPNKIRDDFKKLRESQKKHCEVYNKKPELFFVYFFFSWNLTTSREKMLNLLKELPHLSEKGEKINTYLTIGPRYIWEPIINDLSMDIDRIHLEYTI